MMTSEGNDYGHRPPAAAALDQRFRMTHKLQVLFCCLIVITFCIPFCPILPIVHADTPASVDIPLVAGWNLVSLPLVPASAIPANVLASIAGKYSLVWAYDASTPDQPWRRYVPTDPAQVNTLQALDEKMGLWIKADVAATLTVTGTPASSTVIALHAGWNLVGYPLQASQAVTTALASIAGHYDLVEGYDVSDAADPWKSYSPGQPAYANNLATLQPGWGYWIRATDDCSLTLSSSAPQAPAAVTDLAVEPNSSNAVTLVWSSPGGAAYDLRYSTAPLSESNWTAATAVSGEPVPASAGNMETLAVTGLSASTTYYYGIKTSDGAGHSSGISNVISATMPTPLVNLLANGTFEGGQTDGWRANTFVPTTDEAHSGSWSARPTDAYMETSFSTTPGIAYKVAAWVKIASETGSDWGGFRIEAVSADSVTLAHSGWLLTSDHGNQWFRVALSFVATTSQTRLDAGYFGGAGRTMVVYVDDIQAFRKATNALPMVAAALSPVAVSSLPRTQSFGISAEDSDGAVAHVLWDFGDGTRSLVASGTHTATMPGSYIARVSVSDDEGSVVSRSIPWTATDGTFPGLEIGIPVADTSVVTAPTLHLNGTAGASVTLVRVSTDRGYAGIASGTTSWSVDIPLQPGNNRVLVQAHDAAEHIVASERLVRYAPSGALAVNNLAESTPSIERWEMLEATFDIANNAATDVQFPYDPAPPKGLEWVDGISVDGLFTPDNWQTVYRRPAFLNQRYDRALKSNEEWLYPNGVPVWTVRFAPPAVGTWKYRIEVREAKGSAQSAERTFTVTAPTNPSNHGPVRVAPLDSRYFEYADGTPFLGAGHGLSASPERFSYDMAQQFDAMGSGNQQFFRWWLGGNLWTSAWQPWNSRTLNYDGYIPPTGLTIDRAYGNGLAALRLDAVNPLMFYGFMSGHAGLIPGHTYRLRIRWRTEGVTGPATSGRPYGVCAKFTGWPEVGQTGSLPVLITHVHGNTPWHVAEGDFVATGDLLSNLALILENTTGGTAYVDEVDLYEVMAGSALGPQLLRNPRFNSQLTFDLRRGAGMDTILADAAARGMSFKLVISEKNEYLLNHWAADGLPDPNGGHFGDGEGSPVRRLHTYYWRHLLARFGAYRSVQSWELANEQDPNDLNCFRMTAALATAATTDGNPHLASTSIWASLGTDSWKAADSAPISYADFHAYVRSTGWLEPKEELANDSARLFSAYDQEAYAAGIGKPVIWGEQGIDGNQGSDIEDSLLANDQSGVWLHKMTWARCGPGGVYPLYWYTNNIVGKSLHGIYGTWNRFMADIPLTNGRYQDVAASTSQPDLRVFGQKDLQAGRAHVWIDNAQHTWRHAVDAVAISSIAGTVSIPMQTPNATYDVTWFDTYAGVVRSTGIVTANASGVVVLSVNTLSTDIAAKIARRP